MPAFICVTCGVQAAPSEVPPLRCPICEDERQYVNWAGQQWATVSELAAAGRRNTLSTEESGLVSIATAPLIAIGQRSLLVRTAAGNVLWDSLSFLDGDTVAALRELGGVQAIAVSHPHFYGNMLDWSDAFDCPVYVHAADGEWLQRSGSAVRLWDGVEREILAGVTLLNLGGHFDGATVLHWRDTEDRQGALLTGDTVQVMMDRRFVSFMYSFPNYIPLPDAAIERIVNTLRPHAYDRIYGAFPRRNVLRDAAGAVERSAERYLRMRRGDV